MPNPQLLNPKRNLLVFSKATMNKCQYSISGEIALKRGVIMIDVISSLSPIQKISAANKITDERFGNRISDRSDQQFKTTSQTVIENGKVILEQYDWLDRLIRKTPPGYLPPGQRW
jgi:hypothetical protein